MAGEVLSHHDSAFSVEGEPLQQSDCSHDFEVFDRLEPGQFKSALGTDREEELGTLDLMCLDDVDAVELVVVFDDVASRVDGVHLTLDLLGVGRTLVLDPLEPVHVSAIQSLDQRARRACLRLGLAQLCVLDVRGPKT